MEGVIETAKRSKWSVNHCTIQPPGTRAGAGLKGNFFPL
jgi:hypothetical protein